MLFMCNYQETRLVWCTLIQTFSGLIQMIIKSYVSRNTAQFFMSTLD